MKASTLDTGRLLEIGTGAGPEAAPVVASLCMRLCAYSAELNPGALCTADEVGRWAEGRFLDWATRLAGHDIEAAEATLATDPLNLVLGCMSLADPLQSKRCVEALIDFWNWCREAGIAPVSRLNQAVVRAALPPAYRSAAAPCLDDPVADEDLARALSPFACSSIAICRQGNHSDSHAFLGADKIAAVGLRSVWMRDLPGVGLSLLASTLLHGRPLPDGLDSWIYRITRSDGFIGMWQLYEDAHVRANLFGTVNIYWARVAMAGGRYLGPAHD